MLSGVYPYRFSIREILEKVKSKIQTVTDSPKKVTNCRGICGLMHSVPAVPRNWIRSRNKNDKSNCIPLCHML